MDPSSTAAAGETVVTDNPAASRYEVHVGGALAGFVVYHLRGQQISLIHTEVDGRFQGAGLAARLARYSLDDARKRHLAVLPSCPYIRSWIKKHSEYTDLVPEDRRAVFGLYDMNDLSARIHQRRCRKRRRRDTRVAARTTGTHRTPEEPASRHRGRRLDRRRDAAGKQGRGRVHRPSL